MCVAYEQLHTVCMHVSCTPHVLVCSSLGAVPIFLYAAYMQIRCLICVQQGLYLENLWGALVMQKPKISRRTGGGRDSTMGGPMPAPLK